MSRVYESVDHSRFDSALESYREGLVLDTLETIYELNDEQRENVRHELWEVIDAAEPELEEDGEGGFYPAPLADSFWDAIDAAVARGLAYPVLIPA